MVSFERSKPWGAGKHLILLLIQVAIGVGLYFALMLTGEMILLLLFAGICLGVGLSARALVNLWVYGKPSEEL